MRGISSPGSSFRSSVGRGSPPPSPKVLFSPVGRGLPDAPFRWFFAGDFAACGRRVSFPAMGKKPMAQATFSWPCGPIHLEDRRGTPYCLMLLDFRRAKSEWLSAVQSGPLGPGCSKIAVCAVPVPRLALPSRCSRCWAVGRDDLGAPRMRAGQCPAPTKKKEPLPGSP